MILQTKTFQLATYAAGDASSEKLALVLPGKLDTKDYAHMVSHVNFLASLGYFALSFDPPGTWESPGDITLYTVSNYLKAVDEIIEYNGNKPTFIMGHSRGAAIATIAGARNPHIFAFTAVMSSLGKDGFLKEKNNTWQEQGYTVSKRDLPPGGGEKIKEFKLPYTFYEDQLMYQLTDDIKNSPKPKLFICGKNDTLVTPERVKEAYQLYAEPKELYELNSDHNYRFHPELITEINEVIGKFLQHI